MMNLMLLSRPDSVRRQWFTDARDDGRRMELSWHSDEALVIVSLWHGSMCRATFRMPVEQAPALIETLADALGDAVQPRSSVGPTGKRSTLFERGRDRLRKHVAEIIMLAERADSH
jgi:hypothetical protein